MNLPNIRLKPAARRTLARDPSLWSPLLSWNAALADADLDGSAFAFVQRRRLTSVDWDELRITYIARFDADGILRHVEVWNIVRLS